MISLDNRPRHMEVSEPASPPSSPPDHHRRHLLPPAPSPEIRVTDTPDPVQQSSPLLSPAPSCSSSSSLASSSPPLSVHSPLASPATLSSSSLSRTSPPMHSLFQPYLPKADSATATTDRIMPKNTLPAAAAVVAAAALPRPLPFSIDNILNPTFGQRLLLHQLTAATVAAQQLQQQQHQQQHQHLQQQQHLQQKHPIPHSPVPSSPVAKVFSARPVNSPQPVDLSSSTTPAPSSSKKRRQSAKSPPPHSPIAAASSSETEADSAAADPSKCGDDTSSGDKKDDSLPPGMVRGPNGQLWPAWVFCTRYSDRPSSGPRARKIKKRDRVQSDEKRPRTAFTSDQLGRLRKEFEENRYLNEDRRKSLANELGLNETQIKIWFQNKRAKQKKASGDKGDLAKMLAAQGLYNHATVSVDEDEYPNL